MKRREALKSVAILLGTAISASSLSVILDSCNLTQKPNGKFIDLTQTQQSLLAELVEVIVPTTSDSAGAKEADVHTLIPMILADCYSTAQTKMYTKGLEAFEKAIKEKYTKDFASLSADQKLEATKALRDLTLAHKDKKDEEKDPQAYFFLITRDLTLLGYYSSEIGYTKALAYYNNDIPGKYDGNVALKPGQKRWG